MTDFYQLLQYLAQTDKLQQNWTGSKIAGNQAAQVWIHDQLAAHAVVDLAPDTLGGNMSLVVEVPGKNQVLRIVDVEQERSPVGNPLMLQPDRDLGEAHGVRVQLFPKVKLLSEAITDGSISKKEALVKIMKLADAFTARGQFFWDVRLPNLCFTTDREIKLLDPGSVCPMSERHGGFIGDDTHSNDDKYRHNIAVLCKELGDWAPLARSEKPDCKSAEIWRMG